MDPAPTGGPPRRDRTVPVMIAVLSGLEVAILYVLIAVDTPLAPVVRRALENPFGVFAVVMSVLTVLMFGMAGFLTWSERRARHQTMKKGA